MARFRLSARGAIARVRGLAAVVAAKGHDIAAVVSADPGRVVYEDRQQVLAIPAQGHTF